MIGTWPGYRVATALALVAWLPSCGGGERLLSASEEAPRPAAAETACVAVASAHVGQPAAALTATWVGAAPAGGGTVLVTDHAARGAERVHECRVAPDGRVTALVHRSV